MPWVTINGNHVLIGESSGSPTDAQIKGRLERVYVKAAKAKTEIDTAAQRIANVSPAFGFQCVVWDG